MWSWALSLGASCYLSQQVSFQLSSWSWTESCRSLLFSLSSYSWKLCVSTLSESRCQAFKGLPPVLPRFDRLVSRTLGPSPLSSLLNSWFPFWKSSKFHPSALSAWSTPAHHQLSWLPTLRKRPPQTCAFFQPSIKSRLARCLRGSLYPPRLAAVSLWLLRVRAAARSLVDWSRGTT